MAIIYYPTDSHILSRRTVERNLTEEVISVSPDAIIVITGSSIATISLPSASYATTASYALNGGTNGSGSGTSLTTGSSYPITSSWSVQSSQSLYAPVAFSNVRIVDGKLTILAPDTGNWYALTIYDDGQGSFTTQLEIVSGTGSMF